MLAMWLLWAAVVGAGPGENARMTPCTGTPVAPGAGTLAKAVASAPAGATLCLAAGEYVALVEIERSVTLIGVAGRTVLKGTGRGSILGLHEDGLDVRLEGLTFTGGVARQGGALALGAQSRLNVTDCTFTGNRAGEYGGGALFANRGELTVSGCRFEGNRGVQGGAVLLDGVVRARFEGCAFTGNQAEQGGAVRAREGAMATFRSVTFGGNASPVPGSALRVAGSSSRTPTVTLEGCTLGADTLGADEPYGGQVRVKDSTVPKDTLTVRGVVDAGGNVLK